MRFPSLGLILALTLSSLCPADDATLAQANLQFKLALSQYQKQEYNDALSSLKKVLQAAPRHPQANFLAGVIFCQQQKYDQAVDPLKTTLDANPANTEAWNDLGIAYFQTGRWNEAQAAFKKVAAATPNNAEVFFNLGLLSLKKEAFSDAQAAFQHVLKLQPRNNKAAQGLAQAYLKAGQARPAAETLQKASDLQPSDADLRLQAARAWYGLGDNDKALKVLSPLAGSDVAEAQFILGVCKYRLGDFEGAKACFEKAIRLRPDYPEARFNYAITYYDQGDYEACLQQFDQLLKQHPGDPQARKNQDIARQVGTQSLLKQGSESYVKEDYLEALRAWRRAQNLDPSNSVVKELIKTAKEQLGSQASQAADKGTAAMKAGKLEEAVKNWTLALEMDEDNSQAKQGLAKADGQAKLAAAAYLAKAQAALRDENFDKAAEYGAKAASLDPSKAAFVKSLANARRAKASAYAAKAASAGDLAEKVDWYEKAVGLVPSDKALQTRLNQAKVARRSKVETLLDQARKMDAAKAAAAYAQVLRLEPGNQEAVSGLRAHANSRQMDPAKLQDLYYQGVYAYAAGDSKRAISIWKEVLSQDPGHQLAKTGLERAEKKLVALSSLK